jgi:uncharacterized protein (TIGR00369 family)
VNDDFANTPCNRWLGFRLLERSAERVVIEQTVRTEMLQEGGVVQGGLLTALADTAAVYLLWPDLRQDQTMTGTTVGRTVAVCESTVRQGSRLVAKGTFTYLLRERR